VETNEGREGERKEWEVNMIKYFKHMYKNRIMQLTKNSLKGEWIRDKEE
jgi:hypothetical protein